MAIVADGVFEAHAGAPLGCNADVPTGARLPPWIALPAIALLSAGYWLGVVLAVRAIL